MSSSCRQVGDWLYLLLVSCCWMGLLSGRVKCAKRENSNGLFVSYINLLGKMIYLSNESQIWHAIECIYQEQHQGIKSGGHIETGITKPSVLPLSHSDFLTAKLSPSCMAWLRSYPMPFPPEPFLIFPEAAAAAAVVKAHLYPVIVQPI